jgi:hypothetical protein
MQCDCSSPADRIVDARLGCARLCEAWTLNLIAVSAAGAVGRNADVFVVDRFIARFVHNCDLANVVRSCGQGYLFMDSRVLRK